MSSYHRRYWRLLPSPANQLIPQHSTMAPTVSHKVLHQQYADRCRYWFGSWICSLPSGFPLQTTLTLATPQFYHIFPSYYCSQQWWSLLHWLVAIFQLFQNIAWDWWQYCNCIIYTVGWYNSQCLPVPQRGSILNPHVITSLPHLTPYIYSSLSFSTHMHTWPCPMMLNPNGIVHKLIIIELILLWDDFKDDEDEEMMKEKVINFMKPFHAIRMQNRFFYTLNWERFNLLTMCKLLGIPRHLGQAVKAVLLHK